LLKPLTKTSEASIHVNLAAISETEAFTLINRFLSILAWCDDAPMEIMENGFAGSSAPVAIKRDTSCSCSGCIGNYVFGRDLEQDSKAQLALALYREALTVNSVPFSFLSYFKILNIFWKDKKISGKNKLVEGIRATLPNLHDREAIERIQQLAKGEPDIADYLYKSGRCAIAHANMEPIVDPDEIADCRRLSQDIWIIKAVAEELIQSELHVSRDAIG